MVKRFGIAWGNNCAVFAFDDYFAAAVDVCNYGRQPHCPGLDDNVGKAFAVAREDEGVRGGEPWANIGLLADCLDICIVVYFCNGFGLQWIKFGLLAADKDKPCRWKYFVQALECLYEFIDAFVADEATDEYEGEDAGLAEL